MIAVGKVLFPVKFRDQQFFQQCFEENLRQQFGDVDFRFIVNAIVVCVVSSMWKEATS